MSSLGWLHFSDFHQGMAGQRSLWPTVHEKLLKDLGKLHKLSGPWDVVFFTGDLTQRGSPKEFEQFEKMLEGLFTHLRELGSNPTLLVVPGNHDLVRPKPAQAQALIEGWHQNPRVQREFWSSARSPNRKLINQAFANYMRWRKKSQFPKPELMTPGPLPGDFSATIEKEGVRFGILGLNTAFLQLDGGNYLGRLALEPEQFHESCGGNGVEWAKSHDACLLLSHHPPDWLSESARKVLRGDIADPGRFVAHLFGHMHEGGTKLYASGGHEPWRDVQAPSLFALEGWGTPGETRVHGYSAGQLKLEGERGILRLWPRIAVRHKEGFWNIVPDHQAFRLEQDEGLRPQEVGLRSTRPGLRKATGAREGASARTAPPRESVEPIPALVEGIRELPNDGFHRILSFLGHYVGRRAGGGMPFGGRAGVLAELDQWVDGESPSPYRLLIAPGGRGKSALLAQWVCRLAAREGLDIAYFPVSVRFQTNLELQLFQALGARLTWLRGGSIPSDPYLPVDAWRRRFVDALNQGPRQGRRLLVVIDGLDEAADLQLAPILFPQEPPPGLLIVLSTREMAGWEPERWLRQLGLKPEQVVPMSLDFLEREGITEVLGRLQPPLDRLASEPRVVDELYRLTEGDPLLLKLYLDKVSKHTRPEALPEQLRGLDPGLEGFFQDWWHEQQRLWGSQASSRGSAVNELLGLLSHAFGPLKREELLGLLRSWSGLDLDETLQQVERLLVGDGRQQGLTFTHPRLANYFEARVGPDERRKQAAKFLEWGESTLDALKAGRMTPKEVPSYLVRYHGAHLEREARGPEAFLPLVSAAWLQAVEVHERSHTGFLNDVERARKALHRSSRERISRGLPPALAEEVRCGLARSTVHSLAGNLSPTLIRAFLSMGRWTLEDAHSSTRNIPDAEARVDALLVLAERAPESQRDTYLHEALTVVRAQKDFFRMHGALERIGRHATASFLPTLMGSFEDFGNVESRLMALETLAEHQPVGVRPLIREHARAVVSTIQDVDRRSRWEFNLAHLGEGRWKWLERRGSWGESEPEPSEVASVLTQLLQTPPGRTLDPEIEKTLSQAWKRLSGSQPWSLSPVNELGLEKLLKSARKFSQQEAQASLILLFAPQWPPRLLQEAWRLAGDLEDRQIGVEVMTSLVSRVPEPEQHQAFEELTRAAFAPPDADQVLPVAAVFASLLPEPRKTQALLSVWGARDLARGAKKVTTLASLIGLLPEEKRAEALEEVLLATDGRKDTDWNSLIAQLAPVLAELKAWNLFHENPRGHHIIETFPSKTLEKLIPYVPEAWLDVTWKEVLQDEHVERVEYLFQALGPRLTPALQRTFFDAICSSGNEALCIFGIIGMAPHLEESLLAPALERISACRAWYRCVAVEVLWSRFPGALREKLLEDSVEVARSLEGASHRNAAFQALAVSLAELKGEAAIDYAEEIPMLGWQVSFLVRLVEHLPQARERLIRAVFDRAALESESTRSWALMMLAGHAPEALIPELVEIAQELQEDTARAEALGALASRLPSKQRDEWWAEALQLATRAKDNPLREEPLVGFVPELSRLPRESLHPLWVELLPRISAQARPKFLQKLQVLAPVLHALGGDEEMEGIVRALLEVGRWRT